MCVYVYVCVCVYVYIYKTYIRMCTRISILYICIYYRYIDAYLSEAALWRERIEEGGE